MNRNVMYGRRGRRPQPIVAVMLLALGLSCTTGAAAFAQQVLSVTKQDCQWLVRHDPNGVAYQPGIDVHGRKVASADLPTPGGSGVGGTVAFDLTPDLLSSYGIDLGYTGLAGNAELGKIEIKNGGVSINGKRVGMNERQGLAAICRDKM